LSASPAAVQHLPAPQVRTEESVVAAPAAPPAQPVSPVVQNYKVMIHQLGRYPHGSVLPRYVIERAAGNADQSVRDAVVREKVERGEILPTNEPVNVDLAPPVPRGEAAKDRPEDVLGEVDRLRKALADVTADRDHHKSDAAGLRAQATAINAEIAKYVVADNHWRNLVAAKDEALAAAAAANAELRADVERLTQDLEQATAPDPTLAAV
jgi:hypothetical protein